MCLGSELTEEEVLAQGIQVFIAGFETTASTLRFLTHLLATNPQVQDKLYREIMDIVGEVRGREEGRERAREREKKRERNTDRQTDI